MVILCVFVSVDSAAEIKVPARGKALIPTDLSIAVPEGTYARVGNIPLEIIHFIFSEIGLFFSPHCE